MGPGLQSASFSLPGAFSYRCGLFFLARPQSSVPDSQVTSPSIEWRGPGFYRLPCSPWGPKPVL